MPSISTFLFDEVTVTVTGPALRPDGPARIPE